MHLSNTLSPRLERTPGEAKDVLAIVFMSYFFYITRKLRMKH